MAAILNAIFGTYPDPEPTNTTTVVAESSISNERLHTSAVADDVHIKSVISSETQANATLQNQLNIDKLLAQLSTTHSQVDQYSRDRTAAINEQVQRAIADVLAKTKRQQEELLTDANRRHLIIDNEYKLQLQKAVETLDVVKAKTLADLERDLQAKQQAIMNDAKREIDILNDQANAAKLHVLVEAQEQAKQDINNLTDQVAALGQLDTQNLLQSKTTTIITSQAQATGVAETVVASDQQIAVRSPTELVPASVVAEVTDVTRNSTSASNTEFKANTDNTTF